jgi:hypothetical protein
MRHKAMILWALVAMATLATACSPAGEGTTTSSIDPGSVLVTVEQTGGCLMMGANCPTYVVHANGEVALFRTGGTGEIVDSTFVDPSLATDLAWLMSTTNYSELRAGLAVGECQGCYDGIDTRFIFVNQQSIVAFDSIDTELDPSEPLFGTVWRIFEAAVLATDMPVEQRQ